MSHLRSTWHNSDGPIPELDDDESKAQYTTSSDTNTMSEDLRTLRGCTPPRQRTLTTLKTKINIIVDLGSDDDALADHMKVLLNRIGRDSSAHKEVASYSHWQRLLEEATPTHKGGGHERKG
ncbi:hypothetical protein B296_00039718 [Ensete ventricosum]|uniref:Uncharacterized protein n=1 Tax=Ensete ventricosum TaxID=4639 RepID=A0A426XE41_ENSVE|nr:hypothetical protein B296_00039718 [Ensete ventricosum]